MRKLDFLNVVHNNAKKINNPTILYNPHPSYNEVTISYQKTNSISDNNWKLDNVYVRIFHEIRENRNSNFEGFNKINLQQDYILNYQKMKCVQGKFYLFYQAKSNLSSNF